MKLKDKIALITGGGGGFGRAISLGLAREGAKVAVNDCKVEKANEVVKAICLEGGKAIAVKADISKKDQINDMVDKVIREFGSIDILVNNAGVYATHDFFNVTEEEWDRILNVNTKAVYLVSQAVAKEMVKTGKGGKIINISSISGVKATSELELAYCTSKAGVVMLTKVMALALAKYKINVNAILPGPTPTDLNKEVLGTPEARGRMANEIPLKRLGKTEDIVGAVVLFASSDSDWITGSLLIIDGGWGL